MQTPIVTHCYSLWIFPACRVVHYPLKRYTKTRFRDGSKVDAVPIDSAHYRQTARELGYGSDTTRMSRDHEFLHAFLAVKSGLPHSPTLWAVAHKEKADNAEHLQEETEVMRFQAYLNGVRWPLLPQWEEWRNEARMLLSR